eukprot:168923-Amphidinium_carterae.1
MQTLLEDVAFRNSENQVVLARASKFSCCDFQACLKMIVSSCAPRGFAHHSRVIVLLKTKERTRKLTLSVFGEPPVCRLLVENVSELYLIPALVHKLTIGSPRKRYSKTNGQEPLTTANRAFGESQLT